MKKCWGHALLNVKCCCVKIVVIDSHNFELACLKTEEEN